MGNPFEYTDAAGNEYVFLVYRETAVEYESNEAKEFSRIARVCKVKSPLCTHSSDQIGLSWNVECTFCFA